MSEVKMTKRQDGAASLAVRAEADQR